MKNLLDSLQHIVTALSLNDSHQKSIEFKQRLLVEIFLYAEITSQDNNFTAATKFTTSALHLDPDCPELHYLEDKYRQYGNNKLHIHNLFV